MTLLPYNLIAGTYINAPLEHVQNCLLHWANGNPANRDIHNCGRYQRFAEALTFLEPRFFNPDRAVLIPLANGWTAFFDNHSRQFQPQAELFVLCERLKCQTCFFFEDVVDEHAGSCAFVHNQFADGHVATRSVQLINESRWLFAQNGEPLEFERHAIYASRRVRDRLSPELLREYGACLGVRFWDLEAYLDRAESLGWRSYVPGQRTHGCTG
jgi:hypothetical protein